MKISILCEKIKKFYSKFGWVNFNSKYIKILKDKYVMTFNYLFKNSKKYIEINF